MTNADPQELEKFGELAHKWWDTEGDFKPLHRINPLRLDWIAQRAPLRGQTVLDVGCGGGILAESMAQRGAKVLGIDLSVKPLKVARLHAMESGVGGLDYREVAVEALAAERPPTGDTVTGKGILEHLPDPAALGAASARRGNPGGTVFFSTLNRNAKAFLFAIVGAEHVLKLLPKGTHEYAKFIRPSELSGFARAAGLETLEFAGLEYNPLTQRYWLSGDTSVNYMVACRRPQA